MTDELPLALGKARSLIPDGKIRAQEEWFVCPDWAGMPAKGMHLEVSKDGVVVDRVLIDKLPYYLVGRMQTVVDIPLEHQSISRAHCVFVHHRKGTVYVIDLASGHGVYVNNRRILAKQTVRLTEDDAVRIGGSTRIFRVNRTPPKNIEGAKVISGVKRPAAAAPLAAQQPSKRTRGNDSAHVYHVLLKHTSSRNPKSFRDPSASVKLSKAEAVVQLESLRAELLKSTDVLGGLREAAARTSDCSSAKKGGDMGRVSKGMMLKSVEDTVFAMSPGTLSSPVHSESGVHLIYRAA